MRLFVFARDSFDSGAYVTKRPLFVSSTIQIPSDAIDRTNSVNVVQRVAKLKVDW